MKRTEEHNRNISKGLKRAYSEGRHRIVALEASRAALGQHARGEKHGSVKVTEEQVLELRSLEGTMSQRALARLFKISQTQVWFILHRRNWGWLE